MHYKYNSFKVWISMVIGIVIALILSPLVVKISSTFGFSFYKRDGLDDKL